jgi:hypothetical protein
MEYARNTQDISTRCILLTIQIRSIEVYIAVGTVGYGVFNMYKVGRSSAKFNSDEMIRAE